MLQSELTELKEKENYAGSGLSFIIPNINTFHVFLKTLFTGKLVSEMHVLTDASKMHTIIKMFCEFFLVSIYNFVRFSTVISLGKVDIVYGCLNRSIFNRFKAVDLLLYHLIKFF